MVGKTEPPWVVTLEVVTKLGRSMCRFQVLLGRVSPVGDLRSVGTGSLPTALRPGPLFSWQENRNLENQPVCRCWGLDNWAKLKNGYSIKILYY